jgi:copper oxidase (laccase) domain-containing protein
VHRLRQVHSGEVVVVGAAPPPGSSAWMMSPAGLPPAADAVVAVGSGSCAVVLTADCAPVALGSPEGIHGAVHVGWRGLVAGVIARAVETMRALGATDVVAGIGPTIHRCCYAFGAGDLDTVAGAVGAEVRTQTSDGAPGLDLPAGVRGRLARAGARLVVDVDRCTACGDDAFSYRARGDVARQALFVWRTPSAGAGSAEVP